MAKDIAALRGETRCLGFLGEEDNLALEYLKNLGIQSYFTVIKNRKVKITEISLEERPPRAYLYSISS